MAAANTWEKQVADEMNRWSSMSSTSEDEDDPDKDFVLLLIGKTGHGKSSTGNTILGREKFEISDSLESKTDKISVGWARRKKVVIKVVDGPGIEDTRMKTEKEDVEHFVSEMEQSFVECLEGFHALVLIMSYGIRFTKEEQDAIQKFKNIFGENFIKDHGILIFTHGESFDLKYKGKKTFQTWCEEQESSLVQIIKEFQNRVILFQNLTDDSGKKNQCVQYLLHCLDQIKSRYTNEKFDQGRRARDKLIVELGAPEFREQMRRKINLLQSSLPEVDFLEVHVEKRKRDIERVAKDAKWLQEEIIRMDRKTNVLKDLKDTVDGILKNLNNETELLQRTDELNDVAQRLERERKFQLAGRIVLAVLTLGLSELVWAIFT